MSLEQSYERKYLDATKEDIERLEKKIDAIGLQLNYVVNTVTAFVDTISKSPMSKMFGPKGKDTVNRG